MAQLKGTYLKLYLSNNHIAYLRSNEFSASTNMIDVTNKESLGDKEVIPGLREYTGNFEGWVEQLPVNLLEYSQDFTNAAWDKVGASITNQTQTAPDGSNTAALINYDTDADTLRQEVVRSISNGDVYIASVWLKAASPCTISLILRSDDESQGTTLVCNVTTQWQRFLLAYTFNTSESGAEVVLVRNAGNTVTNIQVWGFQLEQGTASRTLPTAYQPTPRINQGDLYDAMQNETSYTAKLTTGITGENTYTGTAYVSNLNISAPNEEAVGFTCDIAFSGSISTT